MDNAFDVTVLGRSITGGSGGNGSSSSAGASHLHNGHSHNHTHTNSTNSNNGSNHASNSSSSSSNSSLGANTPKTKPLVVTAEQVVKLYGYKLTNYETQEIYGYTHIYFIGANAKKRCGIIGAENNGYDDASGSYIHVPHDHVAYRYEILKVIGRGSFGQVLRVYDHKKQQHVALKMVRNEKRFHKQALEEIRILKHLKNQDKENTMNIIHMYESFVFRNHMCITFELLSVNLYELIKKNKFQGFSIQLVRRFAFSMLKCLEALYNNKVIHCDLKPENVLLKVQGRSGIKVIDFGSSCFENERVYTYIQSRFYRAPEVILGAKYGMPIDIWSLGCILSELSTGYPLLPGEDEFDQLTCIMELLGMPPYALLSQSKRTKSFISSKGYPRYCTVNVLPNGTTSLSGGRSRRGKIRGTPGSKDWHNALKNCDDVYFINFIQRCLEWDPNLRMTPYHALRHSWLRSRRKLPRPPNSFANCLGGDIPDVYGTTDQNSNNISNRLTSVHNLSNSNISSIGGTLANNTNSNANLDNNGGGLLEINLSGSTGTLNQNLSGNNSNVFGSTNNLVLENSNSNGKSNALNNVILLSDKRYYLFGNNSTNGNFKNSTSKSTSSNNTLPPLLSNTAYPL